ncbi:hypothetical protein Tco_1098378 [Tanacetum coccineum]
MWWDDCKRMKKESNKKIRQTILKKSSFMLGLTIPTGIVTLAEEEDKVHTLEFVVEVEVKDVVRATLKIKVNVTPRKTMKIMNKKVNNISNVTSHIYNVSIVISTDTLFEDALNDTETMKLTLMRRKRMMFIMRKVPLPDVEALVLPVFVEELPVVETFFLLAEGLFLGSLLQLVDLL